MSEDLDRGGTPSPPAGGSSDVSGAVLPRRPRRRVALAGVAAALAVVAVTAVAVALLVGALAGRPARPAAGPAGPTGARLLPPAPAASGTAYTAAALPDAVRRLVAAPPPPGTPAEAALRPLTAPAALGECLGRALGPDYPRPLVVDLARWQGAPAVLAVYPDPGSAAKVDAVVVAASCPPGAFLHYAQVRR